MASGASPIVPDVASAITVPVLTSDSIWSLQALPQRLLVVGGGAIGCEMAQAFQRLVAGCVGRGNVSISREGRAGSERSIGGKSR